MFLRYAEAWAALQAKKADEAAQRAQQLQSALDRERSRADEAAKRAQHAEGGVEQKVSAAAQQAERLKAQLEVGGGVLFIPTACWLFGFVGLGSSVVCKACPAGAGSKSAEMGVGGENACSCHPSDGASQ